MINSAQEYLKSSASDCYYTAFPPTAAAREKRLQDLFIQDTLFHVFDNARLEKERLENETRTTKEKVYSCIFSAVKYYVIASIFSAILYLPPILNLSYKIDRCIIDS